MCVRAASEKKKALVTTPLPDYHLQVFRSDVNRDHYLVAVDYFSNYPEVIKVCTSTVVIAPLKFSSFSFPDMAFGRW